MHRSIVIPKGTICSDKTTIIKIPITSPTNTTPLMVINRPSSSYKPSDTQEFKNANPPRSQIPTNQPPEMNVSQRRNQRNEPSRNQSVTSKNMNQINNSQCECYNGKNKLNDNTVQNPAPNTSNIVAYCTDQVPETEDNNVMECECEVDTDDTDPNDIPYEEEPPCFCDDYSNCKYDDSESQYVPCPSNTPQESTNRNVANGTFASRSSQGRSAYPTTSNVQPSFSRGQDSRLQNGYNNFLGGLQGNSTFAPPQRQASNSAYNNRPPSGATNIQERRSSNASSCKEVKSSPQENTVPCPVYLDSINEEEEHPSDNQLNPDMKIINVTSRTYSRDDDGPVEGRTFIFDDPERKGVSTMVFDQLAKSILEEPPENNQPESFRTVCTDKTDFLNSNGGNQQDKKCKC